MAEIDDLLQALEGVLGATAHIGYDAASALHDAYEGYLWSEVIRVAQTQSPPWSVQYVNAGGASQVFRFRYGPGVIYSPTPYSYAVLSRGAKALELHIGIRVAGESTVLHEFDVLLLRQAEAHRARAGSRSPSYLGVAMHLEGKFYSGDLSLGVARALVGLGADCRRRAYLVARNGGPDSIRRLMKHHGCTYVHGVFPYDTGPAFLETCIKSALDHA